MSDPVKEHIDRCIELYGQPLDSDFSEQIDRPAFEQMRVDLMIALGMLMMSEHQNAAGVSS